jgi:hypothetical protein
VLRTDESRDGWPTISWRPLTCSAAHGTRTLNRCRSFSGQWDGRAECISGTPRVTILVSRSSVAASTRRVRFGSKRVCRPSGSEAPGLSRFQTHVDRVASSRARNLPSGPSTHDVTEGGPRPPCRSTRWELGRSRISLRRQAGRPRGCKTCSSATPCGWSATGGRIRS